MLKIKRPKIKIKKNLPCVSKEKSFLASSGREVFDLSDLIKAIEDMSETDFRIHVNSKKNEIKDWLRDSFGDRILARSIRWSTTRETTLKKIREHLSQNYL
jgi:hypothetical protein